MSLPQGWSCGNESGQGGAASANINSGILSTSLSNVGGGSNSYAFATTQSGTFPWSPCQAPANGVLPSTLKSISSTFVMNSILNTGGRFHIYIALYYWLPNGAQVSGGSSYQCLDTQVRAENINGAWTSAGTTETYNPGDSFGWDQVTLANLSVGPTYTLTANISQQCARDESSYGISAPCQLAGIEIGIEGFQFQELNISFTSVSLS